MQSVVLNIYDDNKTDTVLGLLRDLSYVEVRGVAEPGDVYAGIPSKLDDDLLKSQLDVLEKADW
ncbi:hypothetical protein [Treponema sp. R80B11-R83G3]